MSLILTADQRRTLKTEAHHLNPVVLIGSNGLTPEVVAETNVALAAHGLIKVRIPAPVDAEAREAREDMIISLCTECKAAYVQRVGHVVTLYREKPNKEAKTPEFVTKTESNNKIKYLEKTADAPRKRAPAREGREGARSSAEGRNFARNREDSRGARPAGPRSGCGSRSRR